MSDRLSRKSIRVERSLASKVVIRVAEKRGLTIERTYATRGVRY